MSVATTLEEKGVMVRALVEQAMRGDRESFGELVERTSNRMYAMATRILRDAELAEDAVQGALMVVTQGSS